ncbi:MAG: peptidylprolyl isomerase [Bacteroidales bacterium]|nr:peptidylprolyl isomerase [Bacteroidales bacterium]
MKEVTKTVFLPVLFGWTFLLLSGFEAISQGKVVDRVISVVGKNMILESEIEAQYLQYRMQSGITGSAVAIKCQILENMLLENLLLNQADLDSITVTEGEVEQSLDQRLRYFISQFGSQDKLEEYYQKSIIEIKEEFRELVRNQLLVRKVQENITANVFVTPSEVRAFYKTIPLDSLPLINAEVEMVQILKIPPISMEQRVLIKEKLRDLRRRIVAGENFATLAILYSEDPGSASKGGEIGFFGRGELYPEYEAAAFKLKEGEISEIIESKAGYHVIQLLERRGDYVNTRHILLQTKPSPVDMEKARQELDSIMNLIRNNEMTFEEAVTKFSDDPGKNSGGLIINAYTGTTKFEMDQLEPQLAFIINRLEVGQYSNPVLTTTEEGQEAYRLVKLLSRTEPHRANLTDDYSNIQEWALMGKQQLRLSDWVNKNMSNAYIMVIDDYRSCDFEHNWFMDDR